MFGFPIYPRPLQSPLAPLPGSPPPTLETQLLQLRIETQREQEGHRRNYPELVLGGEIKIISIFCISRLNNEFADSIAPRQQLR